MHNQTLMQIREILFTHMHVCARTGFKMVDCHWSATALESLSNPPGTLRLDFREHYGRQETRLSALKRWRVGIENAA